ARDVVELRRRQPRRDRPGSSRLAGGSTVRPGAGVPGRPAAGAGAADHPAEGARPPRPHPPLTTGAGSDPATRNTPTTRGGPARSVSGGRRAPGSAPDRSAPVASPATPARP